MHYYTRMAQFSYRTAFVAAAVTYGIVVYKTLRARSKAGMQLTPQVAISLIADENVQYLCTWLAASNSPSPGLWGPSTWACQADSILLQ